MTAKEREQIKQEVRKEIMEEMKIAKQRKEEYAVFTKGLDKLLEKVYQSKCKERTALKSAISSIIKTCMKLDRLSNIRAEDMKIATELAGKVVNLVLDNKRGQSKKKNTMKVDEDIAKERADI